MVTYESITLKEELVIRKLVSLHYFEYTKDYVFEGESHDFWEFLCVDSGAVEVTAGEQVLTLRRNEMIFHKPNEFHALRADGVTAPNLIVASFYCDAPCMKFFENLIVTINETEQFYLGQMLSEGRRNFLTPLNNPNVFKLLRSPDQNFGSEQVIKVSLESLLISIYRRCRENKPLADRRIIHPRLRRGEDELFEAISKYLQENVYGHLTVAQICKENSVGRSQLQKLFHDKADCGVIEFFSRLKIETAQQLIRKKNYNYTQIASLLGYSSYQYFSLQFKRYTRMTPSQYSSSVMNFSGEESRQEEEN